MNRARFEQITARFSKLRIAVVGDVCLDRYMEIDSSLGETSIETGLPVHNVTNVRSQPGAAGTIVNNLVALGIQRISVVGFAGKDGEGFELMHALRKMHRNVQKARINRPRPFRVQYQRLTKSASSNPMKPVSFGNGRIRNKIVSSSEYCPRFSTPTNTLRSSLPTDRPRSSGKAGRQGTVRIRNSFD